MTSFYKDQLKVEVHPNRPSLGAAAAKEVAGRIREVLAEKNSVNIIFASAPSQNEFLDSLIKEDIDWSRVVAFHMDEYVGLPVTAPQSFGYYLADRLFRHVMPGEVHYIKGDSPKALDECNRYSSLLAENPVDIVCLGIGENTHLAFNDPHVADFNDKKYVKVVDLDADCRNQQVNDGCFLSLNEVPAYAITITIPALLRARYAVAMVPGIRKADAIYHTLNEEISEKYPSTILRTKRGAILYIDEESASKIEKK